MGSKNWDANELGFDLPKRIGNSRMGLIGYGSWGQKLARVMADLGILEWVKDENPGLQMQASFDHPTVEFYEGAEEDVDAVVIATPPRTHFDVCDWALERDLHVLCEKPLAMTTHHAGELLTAAHDRGLILMVDHTFLFVSHVLQMADWLAQIGPLKYLRLNWTNSGIRRRDVDVLWSVGPHPLSILYNIMGRAYDDVRLQSAGWNHETPHAEFAQLSGLWKDVGVVAEVTLSWLDPVKRRQVVAVGHNGSLVCDAGGGELSVYDAENKLIYRDIGPISPEPLQVLLGTFLKAISDNKNPPIGNALEATHVIGMLELAATHPNTEIYELNL